MRRWLLAAMVFLALPVGLQAQTAGPYWNTPGGQWNAGNVTTLGTDLSLSSGTLSAKPTAYTVATLPTCNTAEDGTLAEVTDFTGTPTYDGALTGGGTTHLPVFCNGTAWTQH